MNKKQKINFLVPTLFILYIALLIWIILFKLQFSIRELETFRSINLMPFHYDNEVGARFHLKEILENVAIFAPLGIYLCMFKREPNFITKVISILGISIALETAQYILAVGRSDITDLITNTMGGILGIGIYYVATKLFHNRKRANQIIIFFAAVVTVIVGGILIILFVAN